MRQKKIGYRYARALFDLAAEKGQVEEVVKDIERIREIDHAEFRRVLLSPVISGDRKVKLFESVFGDHISPLTHSFFNLVFQKGRVTALNDIREAFIDLYRQHKRVRILKLTTAVPISKELSEDLRARFQKRPRFQNDELVMEEYVDESIIGGFIVQVDDIFYDASIRHDLHYIKKQFVENMYVQRIR